MDEYRGENGRGALMITGASSGIGRACALHMDRRGYRVFAGVRKQADADSLRAEASPRLVPVFIDVCHEEMIAAAAEQVAAAVGANGLMGLVNNAGVAVAGPMEFLPMRHIRMQMEINYLGQVAVTQAFLPLLRAGNGRVANISSVSGRVANAFTGPYAASKFALEAFSDSLRRELLPWGIHVAAIEPGAIGTSIWGKSWERILEIADEMPPEFERYYGGLLRKAKQRLDRIERRTISPEDVALAVERALTDRRPKARYPVGWDSWAVTVIRRFVPDKVIDWAVGRMVYG